MVVGSIRNEESTPKDEYAIAMGMAQAGFLKAVDG